MNFKRQLRKKFRGSVILKLETTVEKVTRSTLSLVCLSMGSNSFETPRTVCELGVKEDLLTYDFKHSRYLKGRALKIKI